VNKHSEPAETWVEAWPLDVAARAVRFVGFLHEAASAADVELEPAEGGRYRFRVSAAPSVVMEALLASSEFFPESVHSSLSGPLAVRLGAADSSGTNSAKRPPVRQTADTAPAESAPPQANDSDSAGSPLLQAFEHLDQALGETPAAP
jgi:hypothetical protein